MAFNKIYTPQRDSLASSVCGFFTNNPDEILTLDDISDKFMASRANIHTLLGRCVETELLRRGQNEDGEYIYQAGARLITQANQGVNIDTAHKGRKKATPNPTPATPIPDIDDIVIEDGIPLPDRESKRRDWSPLLTKLKTNQSAALPLRAYATLKKDITTQHNAGAGKYKTKSYPDTATVRVWRVA